MGASKIGKAQARKLWIIPACLVLALVVALLIVSL